LPGPAELQAAAAAEEEQKQVRFEVMQEANA
jgi:hypothetical protein